MVIVHIYTYIYTYILITVYIYIYIYTGWWCGTFVIFPYWEYSSQLTNSYFSEGIDEKYHGLEWYIVGVSWDRMGSSGI